jgi:hypothetical protein
MGIIIIIITDEGLTLATHDKPELEDPTIKNGTR